MKRFWLKILIVINGLLLLVLAGYFYYNYQNKKFEIIFFNVGQGDSIFINLPGNNEIVIDGGPDNTALYKLGTYMPIYDRTIELVILSHPHSDHCSGLVEILKRYDVKKVMHTGINYKSGIYQVFLDEIKKQNIETIKPEDIDKIKLDKDNVLEIIYPWESLKSKTFEDINDSSIVVKFNTPYKDFLLVGDISIDIEKEILENDNNSKLKSEVLKVAHQGSETSSSQEFLKAVQSKWAVISVGENKFGHPSLRVIRRLEHLGVEVFRTDVNGDIKFKIDKS